MIVKHLIKVSPAELVAGLTEMIIVADKGYDSEAFRDLLMAEGNRTYIPKRKGAKSEAAFNTGTYRKRHRVGNFFGRIKRFRRVATRYEKTKLSYEGFLMFACVLDWIT